MTSNRLSTIDPTAWLEEMIIRAGYQPSPKGVCCGLVRMLMQAYLANDLPTCIKRLRSIHESYLKGEAIIEHSDTDIFFQGIMLYNNPHLLPNELFDVAHPRRQSIALSSPLALSQKLDDGITIFEPIHGAYHQESLTNVYFKQIKSIAKSFPLILDNYDHSIFIWFDKQWKMIDPRRLINAKFNGEEMGVHSFESDEAMADALLRVFSHYGIKAKHAIFSTHLCATKSKTAALQKEITVLQKNSTWAKAHKPSAENALVIDALGYSLLHLYTVRGDTTCVQALIKAGANVNQAIAQCGTTPLFTAVSLGYIELTRLLLDSKANPNVKRRIHGETPLIVAASLGFTEIVDLLLTHGADPAIETKEHQTAYTEATRYHHDATASRLKR